MVKPKRLDQVRHAVQVPISDPSSPSQLVKNVDLF